MKKMLSNKKGFTLIEMLIAMSIFVIFVGILISSFSSVVRAQQGANDYRILYSEARRVFDKFTQEVRAGAIYYPIVGDNQVSVQFNTPVDSLVLVSEDGKRFVNFLHKDGHVLFGEAVKDEKNGLENVAYSLTDEVFVKDLQIFVSPAGDPYNPENVYADSLQFQPKVTISAKFEKESSGRDPYILDLKTTVSSRFYTATSEIDGLPVIDFSKTIE